MAAAEYDEEALVRGLRAGTREAFQELLERHERRVYNIAYRMLDGNRSDAEDAAQDIFVEIYRSIARFGGRSRLDTWIHRIAVNVCLQRRRKRKLTTVELPDADVFDPPSGDAHDDPLTAVERGELRDVLAKAVSRLPDGQREAVLLHGMQGLSYSEVAEVLECPIGTVKSRISTAFRRLRTMLTGYADEALAAEQGAQGGPVC